MAGTTLFKNTSSNAHRARYLTNEDNFSVGMKYTAAPHATGYAKALVNFDLKNDGECLVPRGGFHDIASRIAAVVAEEQYIDFCTHHASAAYVQDGNDATLCNYHIIGGVTEAGFDLGTASLIVEHDGKYLQAEKTPGVGLTGHLLMKPTATTVQGLRVNTPKSRDGIHTSLEGNTYVLVNTGVSNKLGVLKIAFNDEHTGITWYVEEVAPAEIQPTQAINYGYNMFKNNPYTFENSITASGGIQLTGVIPYDAQGKLLLTARPGTPIVFRLYYNYPQSDVDNGDKYLVQWEVQDLNNASDSEVIQKVRGSEEYTPGDNIEFSYTPSYTAFSIIVRLYKKSEMDAQDAAWEKDTSLQALVTKDDYLTPNRVTTLASYYLTSNSNSSTLNVEAVAYDMGTATGMCTWQQRLVMWGVRNAKSTIFISEINNPGYMPYPNNCEIFNSDIICAIPYLSHLLVFTTTSLYKLTIGDDGLSYTSKCVQERLNMQPSDAASVLTVQNMVYFKSGNYYYMVVPNNTSATEETQLAPVSRSVEQMLDNMEDTLKIIINEVYNFTTDLQYNPIQLTLLDYNTYVANTQVRNVYKLHVARKNSAMDTRLSMTPRVTTTFTNDIIAQHDDTAVCADYENAPNDFKIAFTDTLNSDTVKENWKVLTLGSGTNKYTENVGVMLGRRNIATFTTTYEFAVTAPVAGYYNFSITSGKYTNGTINARVYVNDDYVGDVSTLISSVSLDLLGVYLNEGDYANKIRLELYTPSGTNGRNCYFYLKSLDFTVPTNEKPLKKIVSFTATAEKTNLNVGETTVITTVPESFVACDGVLFDTSKAVYACASVGKPGGIVKATEDGVTAVSFGNTNVIVTASIAGVVVSASNVISFTVTAVNEAIIDVCLNYDTVLRAWTLYTYQATPYRMTVYKPSVTGETVFTHLFVDDCVLYSSLVQADAKNPKDSIELNNKVGRTFGNWQLIDTGYRNFSEELKKRFREVQFCVNVLDNNVLKFNTAFTVDDVDVVPLYRHVVSQCVDPNDSNYGVIFVERELMEGVHTPEITAFDEWELDTAMFPDVTVHKIRYKVSGKGYGGSVKILSKNEIPFELLHISWVYRVMFAR